MSCSLWRWTEQCEGRPCCGDCDNCSFEPIELLEPMYCPFCGGNNIDMFTDRKCYENLVKKNGKSAIGIYCKDCDCQLWDFTYTVKDYWERRNMLVEKWNTRHFTINGENLI